MEPAGYLIVGLCVYPHSALFRLGISSVQQSLVCMVMSKTIEVAQQCFESLQVQCCQIFFLNVWCDVRFETSGLLIGLFAPLFMICYGFLTNKPNSDFCEFSQPESNSSK